MQQIWNINGVQVWLTGANANTDPCFEGFATKEDLVDGPSIATWQAFPRPKGYTIEVSYKGRNETLQSQGTLNLGLEVAQAINRTL